MNKVTLDRPESASASARVSIGNPSPAPARSGGWYGSILVLALLGAWACNGGTVTDGTSVDGTAGFQLRTCVSDADCGDGSACLPEKCDAACVPDPNGRCVACPGVAGGICMPAATDGTVPAAPECFAGRLGDPAVCDKAADWGRQAVDACAGRGAELIDLHALLTCPDGRPSGVVFTCCAFAGGMPPDPSPPNPSVCTQIPVKSDPANPDPMFADPKMAADQQCRAMGLELRDLKPGDADASGAVYLWFATCCGVAVVPPDPPIPDPAACTEIPVGDGSCDATVDLKDAAYQRCQATGGVIQDIRVRNTCADGSVGAIIATCCGRDVPIDPPVDPQPTCISVVDAGDTSCKAYDVWKAYANDKCAAMNLTLVDVSPYESCGDNMFRYMKYACC